MENREVTEEAVDAAVVHLREQGLLSDTGPDEHGRRSKEQWLNAAGEDMGVIRMSLAEATGDENFASARSFAIALKEARRLQSDIYRMAKDICGVEREDIDAVGPL